MRLAAAAQWRPAPGIIVEWLPTDATRDAATAAPPHPVGPSFLQRDHINAVVAGRAMGREHRGYTCGCITVAEDLDVDRMTGAISAVVHAHKGLRSTFTESAGQITRRLIPAADFAVYPAYDNAVEPDPRAAILARLPKRAVFDAVPGVAFGAITRNGSFDLYYAMDHAFGDGSSQVLGIVEILSRYQGATDGDIFGDAEPGSHIEYTAAEYERAAAMTAESPAVAAWREALAIAGRRLPAFPLPLGLPADNSEATVPVYVQCEQLLDAETTTALAELAKRSGAKFTAILYAGLALTEKLLAGRHAYATATVLSTRGLSTGEGQGHKPHTMSQGWYCNFAPISFAIDGDSIESILPAAAAAVEQAKGITTDPVHGALAALMAEDAVDPTALGSPQMVNFLDFRWFPELTNTSELLVFTGQGRTRNASIWLTRSADGLRINSQRPDNAVAAASVTRYFQTLRDVLSSAVVPA